MTLRVFVLESTQIIKFSVKTTKTLSRKFSKPSIFSLIIFSDGGCWKGAEKKGFFRILVLLQNKLGLIWFIKQNLVEFFFPSLLNKKTWVSVSRMLLELWSSQLSSLGYNCLKIKPRNIFYSHLKLNRWNQFLFFLNSNGRENRFTLYNIKFCLALRFFSLNFLGKPVLSAPKSVSNQDKNSEFLYINHFSKLFLVFIIC